MPNDPLPEPWLRGPLPGIPPLLMPAAHALEQAREDAARAVDGLTEDQIWTRPNGAASVGFHLRHLAGALDRLLTYARGERLTEVQRRAVIVEGERSAGPADAAGLIATVSAAIDKALDQIREVPESALLDPRGVGRQQLPSTVLGLIVHSAEHATRHGGQAITTARILRTEP